jgi:glycosyltransferase involved in cell wall biosynthesis
MKVLVWQWGRFGAGPRVACELAEGFRSVPGVRVTLSLARGAEILAGPHPPQCDLPITTYTGAASYAGRCLAAPLMLPRLAREIRALAPDIAVCAMPGPFDLLMGAALHRIGVPYAVIIHDADPHPGDGYPFQMTLQRALARRADALVALSSHVAARLREQGLAEGKALLRASLPPHVYGPRPPLPFTHGGKLRLLSFGRLLPYKGLDLLVETLQRLGPRPDLEVRVVGSGPESAALATLRSLPGVTVENRWVPEEEVGPLLAWSDAVILSHREASQSGVAAAAAAAGRWVVATRVGGIEEQLRGQACAVLCEPEADSLAEGVRRLLRHPAAPVMAEDPVGAWRRKASGLLRELYAVTAKKADPDSLAVGIPSAVAADGTVGHAALVTASESLLHPEGR